MTPLHVHTIVEHGFTERQARFLGLVMRHSGVCVPRQYAQAAGIAQGAKCNAFFDRLVRRGHARAIECMHNRARLYLVHSRLLYHAIGELSSRYRRPVSPRLALERVMRLDAILSTPADQWLTTPTEKAAALPLTAEVALPDGLPIGVQTDGRIVVLYLAQEPWPDAFRPFLRAHVPLLQSVPPTPPKAPLPLSACGPGVVHVSVPRVCSERGGSAAACQIARRRAARSRTRGFVMASGRTSSKRAGSHASDRLCR